MNILLKYKLKGYKRALINKKKKRQHGKPLNFKLTTPEDGKATFYSPNKIYYISKLFGCQDPEGLLETSWRPPGGPGRILIFLIVLIVLAGS